MYKNVSDLGIKYYNKKLNVFQFILAMDNTHDRYIWDRVLK